MHWSSVPWSTRRNGLSASRTRDIASPPASSATPLTRIGPTSARIDPRPPRGSAAATAPALQVDGERRRAARGVATRIRTCPGAAPSRSLARRRPRGRGRSRRPHGRCPRSCRPRCRRRSARPRGLPPVDDDSAAGVRGVDTVAHPEAIDDEVEVGVEARELAERRRVRVSAGRRWRARGRRARRDARATRSTVSACSRPPMRGTLPFVGRPRGSRRRFVPAIAPAMRAERVAPVARVDPRPDAPRLGREVGRPPRHALAARVPRERSHRARAPGPVSRRSARPFAVSVTPPPSELRVDLERNAPAHRHRGVAGRRHERPARVVVLERALPREPATASPARPRIAESR